MTYRLRFDTRPIDVGVPVTPSWVITLPDIEIEVGELEELPAAAEELARAMGAELAAAFAAAAEVPDDHQR